MPYWDAPLSGTPSAPDTSGGWTWGDVLNAGLSSAGSLASGVGALGRAVGDQSSDDTGSLVSAFAEYLQTTTGQYSQDRLQDMTPVAKQAFNAALGSDQFWAHPVLSAGLKAVGMAPAAAAAMIPGGVMADAMAATVTGAAAFGAMSAGDVTDQIYQSTDALSDEDLKAQSPAYAKMRTSLPEDEARRQYNTQLLGMKPVIAAVVGAAAGLIPAGGSVVKDAAIGAGAFGAQSGVNSALVQSAAVQAGQQPGFDPGQVVDATIQGAITGGILGAGAGLLHGRTAPEKAPTTDAGVRVVEPGQPSPDQAAALAEASKPGPVSSPVAPVTPEVTPAVAAAPKAADVVAQAAPAIDKTAATVTRTSTPKVTPDSTIVSPEIAAALAPKKDVTPAVATPAPKEVVPPAAPAKEVVPSAATTAAVPEAKPVAPADVTAPRAPRVLQDVSPAAKEVQANANKQLATNLASIKAEGAAPGVSKDLTRTAKRQADGQVAKGIFDRFVPEKPTFPQTPAEKQALSDRLDQINKAATAANVFVPKKTYDSTPDHLVWLREAQDLAAKFSSKKGPTDDQIQTFLGRESAAKSGDFSVMRGERRAAGEAAMRQNQGDVGAMAAPAPEDLAAASSTESSGGGGGGGEKDAVATSIATSAKRSVNTFDEEKASTAAPVKKVAVTPEVTAKALAALEAAKKRSDAKAAPAPTPEKAGSKGEAVKAVAKKRSPSIAAEAKKVETAPTEAQKEAGNYKKGHIKVQGLDISIENPKGSERSGVGPDGKPWSVKMPDHYGYIKRTEGADGDHVDAYVGPKPESKHVFVIDQVNPDTRAFDEHKAMIGYENAREAVDAYNHAFSDGRAAERVGDFRAMSMDEFKTWLKEGNTKKPAGEPELAAEAHAEASREKAGAVIGGRFEPNNFDRANDPRYVAGYDDAINDREFNPPKGLTKEELDGYEVGYRGGAFDRGDADASRAATQPERLRLASPKDEARSEFEVDRTTQTGFGPAITPMADGGAPNGWTHVEPTAPTRPAKEVWDRSIPRIDNLEQRATTTSTVSGFLKTAGTRLDLMGSLTRSVPNSKLAAALFPKLSARIRALAGDVKVHVLPDDSYEQSFPGRAPGFATGGYYDHTTNSIVVPERTLGAGAERFAHIMLHESTHAAFMRATYESPSIRNAVERIAQELKAALPPENHGIYALTNVDEFIAESFSNPDLQRFMAKVPASPDLAMALDVNRVRKIGGAIRSLWTSMVDVARRALGLDTAHNSLLDAIMQIGGELEHAAKTEAGTGPLTPSENIVRGRDIAKRATAEGSPWKQSITTNVAHIADEADGVTKKIADLWNRPDLAKTAGKPKLLRWVTLDHIARTSDAFFGKDNNPVRKIADLNEQRRVQKDRNLKAAEPVILKQFAMEKKYRAVDAGMVDGKPVTMWDKFTSLLHDETMAGVYADKSLADNKQLGKDALAGVWGKSQHADLARRYAELPQELKDLRAQDMKYFAATQRQMSLGLIHNTIKAMTGLDDHGLASRLLDDNLTEADKAAVEPAVLEHVKNAQELSNIKGPYSPMMRRGDHVVTAYYKIDAPTGANVRAVGDTTHGAHEFEFKGPDARKDAIAFAQKQDTRPTISSVWVDKTTGERYVKDTDGTEIRVTPQDANAEQRFQVSVQNRHVEFVDGMKEARRLQKELEDQVGKTFTHVNGAEVVKNTTTANSDLVSHQMQTLVNSLQRRDGFKSMTPAMQNELTQSLREASLRMLGSTRIQTKRLPRRYVEGASHDFTRNVYEYAQSTSGYLAKLQYQPQLDAAMKELADASTGDHAKETSLGRSAINEEVKRRVTGDNGFQQGGKYSPAVQRVLTSSFISHLASVSYSIINATQPIMLTGPMLYARHGLGRGVGAMARAYSDIGAAGIIKQGAVDTFKKARDSLADTGNFLESTKAKLTAREGKMLDTLASVGSIDPEGGMEVGHLPKQTRGQNTIAQKAVGAFDQGLSKIDAISRQMPTAIEAINRYVSALAAYRLEFAKTGNHDASVQYAQDVVNATQFNYSATNAAPIFNHPLARIAFQFKKFGAGVYQLLGQQIGKAYRNAEPGDRAEALKALGYIAGMHVAAAGTLGLPTEPIKALVMGAHLAGLTGASWQDVEDRERQIAAGLVGPKLGEMLTRGLPRGIPGGFAPDISGRIGLDTLFTFGEPKTTSVNDAALWFANTIGGAPFGLAQSWYTGVQKLTSGDLTGAAQELIPMKTFTDSLKAYQVATEGKKSSTGQGTMSPYSLPEAGMRVLGFTPAREAEDQAQRAVFYGKQAASTASRTAITDKWINAAPQDRQRMWGQVEQWNAGQPAGNRVTRAQLDSAAKRRATSVTSGATRAGIRTTSRTSAVLDQLNQTYNAQ